MKRWIGLGFFIACLLLTGLSIAEELTVTSRATNNEDTTLRTSEIDGQTWLFLPACVLDDQVTLCANADGPLTVTGDAGRSVTFAPGDKVDVASLFAQTPSDGCYKISVTAQSGQTRSLNLLFSANLRSMFLISDDPVNQGRAYVDDSLHHETQASGWMALICADGSAAYEGGLDQIRGRGNSTWGNYPLTSSLITTVNKKPYQITLSRKTDLLDTQDPAEANKHWILLADYYDGTMLHNRISYAIARELGLACAPDCESVDLYYDGEYRGQYLLAEKPEVSEGRVSVSDYDKILQTLNKHMGIDVEALPQVKGTNQYNEPVAATDGVVDDGQTSLGGYLIEMDRAYYTQERAYFGLRDGTFYTVANPKYASLGMVTYLSELFEEISKTLANNGVNPDTGASWTDYLDTDTLLPYYWVNKLSKNPDTWLTSSTYFVLPQGGGKLSMGPVWDFDQSYYLRSNEKLSVADPLTLGTGQTSWAYDLERIPAFQTLAKAFFSEKVAPVVSILLGDENAQGVSLHSLSWYWQYAAASRRMNDVLWNPESIFGTVVADTYDENYENLRSFLRDRYAWLTEDVASWPEAEPTEAISLTMTAPYANVEGQLSVTLDDLHTNAALPAVELTQLEEATKDAFATWQADITVSPKPGVAIPEHATVTVNGTLAPFTRNEDGSIAVSVLFEDPSYRLAEYDGTDYGLVFNAQYYAEHYPEIVAEVGDDPEALLAYYVDHGIEAHQVANAFFDPQEALDRVPDITALFGDSASDAVNYFLESGYENLMSTLDKTFAPDIRPAGL